MHLFTAVCLLGSYARHEQDVCWSVLRNVAPVSLVEAGEAVRQRTQPLAPLVISRSGLRKRERRREREGGRETVRCLRRPPAHGTTERLKRLKGFREEHHRFQASAGCTPGQQAETSLRRSGSARTRSSSEVRRLVQSESPKEKAKAALDRRLSLRCRISHLIVRDGHE